LDDAMTASVLAASTRGAVMDAIGWPSRAGRLSRRKPLRQESARSIRGPPSRIFPPYRLLLRWLLLVRMFVGGRGVRVTLLAMFERGSRMLLRLFVLTEVVMMGGLVMMMGGGVVMSGSLMVMFTGRMLR
jgi:hypothetical protein